MDDDLKKFKEIFRSDYEADERWRIEARESYDFYDGYQWTSEQISILEKRKQPVVTINRIKPRLDAIFGIQRSLQVDTKVFPIFQKETEALVLSEAIRAVEDENNFDQQESLVFEDALISGRGWFKISKNWDGLKKKFVVKRVDNFSIILDANASEQDLSDAERIHEIAFLEPEKIEILFNVKAKELVSLETSRDEAHVSTRPKWKDNFGSHSDDKKRKFKIVTTWYRSYSKQELFFHPELETPIDVSKIDSQSLKTLKDTYKNFEIVNQIVKELNAITFCENVVLEHKKNIRPWDPDAKFPFVLMTAYRDRRHGIHYGIVRQMKDPQREVNKRRSKLLHLLNVNRVRFEEGAFDDENLARQEFLKPDGWIRQRKDFQVVVESNTEVALTHFQILQQATNEIDTAVATREVEGRSSATSGRDFQLRQAQGAQTLRKLFSNLREARRHVALFVLDEILKDMPELKTTKYDVFIDEAPETLNLSSETFDQLIQLASLAKVPVPIDMLIKVSPLAAPVKNEFLERIKIEEQKAQIMTELQLQLETLKKFGNVNNSASPALTGESSQNQST